MPKNTVPRTRAIVPNGSASFHVEEAPRPPAPPPSVPQLSALRRHSYGGLYSGRNENGRDFYGNEWGYGV